jgi:hypothetical protein
MAKKTTRSKKTARRAKDPCAPLRKRIAMVTKQIEDLREFLPEAPPSERPRINAAIRRLEILLRGLLTALRKCEEQH